MMFVPPKGQIWHLFLFEPYNLNTRLRVRMWVRIR